VGTVLKGKPVVDSLRGDLKHRIGALKNRGINPSILILRVGEREDDISYEKGILKNCDLIGLANRRDVLSKNITTAELIKKIQHANKDSLVHGIMLFRPLPKHIDEELVCRSIAPFKDIDCMNPVNLEKVFQGGGRGIAPCTPQAVVTLLKHYEIPLNGANVAVVGRSTVVGKPLAMLLLDENATVTICHSKTKDLPGVTRNADIVVAAVGRAKMMGADYFTEDSIVVDVGINDDGNGGICGDVDFDSAAEKVKLITPAIGGIGLITTTTLLSHVVDSCEKANTVEVQAVRA